MTIIAWASLPIEHIGTFPCVSVKKRTQTASAGNDAQATRKPPCARLNAASGGITDKSVSNMKSNIANNEDPIAEFIRNPGIHGRMAGCNHNPDSLNWIKRLRHPATAIKNVSILKHQNPI
ncbi:hypothetical protein [Paraburkholderia sp. GAS199]|uniref:hypothetical protein n=1 Tax=Paraburkholderia sp. GAS199 TaxID=3035126 RepID=UPI003D194EF6